MVDLIAVRFQSLASHLHICKYTVEDLSQWSIDFLPSYICDRFRLLVARFSLAVTTLCFQYACSLTSA